MTASVLKQDPNTKGFKRMLICILGVRVKINKRSFEPFCILFLWIAASDPFTSDGDPSSLREHHLMLIAASYPFTSDGDPSSLHEHHLAFQGVKLPYCLSF